MRSGLNESDAFKIIANSTSDAILIIDESGMILFANPATEVMMGYSAEDLLGRGASILVSNEQRSHYVDLFVQQVRSNTNANNWDRVELEGRKSNGEHLPVEISFGEFRMQSNRLFTLIVRDISERRKKETELRNYEIRERMLLAQIPAIIWTTDRNLKVLTSQGTGLNELRMKPDQFVGKTLYEIMQADDPTHPAIAGHLNALKGKNYSEAMEWSGHTFQCRIEPFRNNQGEIIGCLGVALDITEKKFAERALEISEHRYRSLFERNLAGVYQSNTDGSLISCNEAFAQIVGYTRDELMSKQPRKGLVDRGTFESFIALLKEHGTLTNVEMEVKRKDGSAIWILENACLLQDGETETILGTIIDITELKNAEKALRKAEQLELFERLVSGVAHEVRSPLFAISTATQVLEKGATESDKEYANLILMQVERLKKLTVELMELSHSDKEWLMSDYDIGKLITNAKKDLEFSNPGSERMLRVSNGTANILIHGNSEKLHQVFSNILQNAVQHSPSVEGAIEVAVTPSDKDVTIRVKDCGTGIATENMNHIFEPFFTTRPNGTGLGLLIAKQIIEAHHGNIRAYNNVEGPGCTFEIVLPRSEGSHNKI